MDKKLKEAIVKGKSEKEAKVHDEEKIRQNKTERHHEMIKSYLPKARKWINEVLFAKIAQAEKEMQSYSTRVISLRDNEDGIPAQAICEAARKIKGLHPGTRNYSVYENAECVGVEISYQIEWDANSEDTNNKG